MTFSSEEEVRIFYNSYAQNVGFGICKLGGRNGDDGKQKYFSVGCAKNGRKVSQAKNILYPRPSTKTNCKAKINVAIRNDGNFVITSLCLEHNHILSPGKSRHFRCNKVLDSAIKRKLELNDQAGITSSKSFQSFVVEAGGYENLTFDERKCRNYISEARRLRLGDGDAEALSTYFCRMQSRNSNFFYVLDLDGESRIRNIFWADARCRAAYEYFSDVVTFDTTYLTNSYDMPFAPFVGVNHHGQSILLGCGLLSSEDSTTFIWLFKELDCKLKCVCRLFEFRGILCRHVIKVLIRMKVTEVPMNYIVDRWRKDIKRGYQSISNIYDDYDTKEKLIVNDLEHSRAEQLKGVSTFGAKAIHSPLKVRSRGRPPTKRKQSKIEQIVKKSVAKARKEASLTFFSNLSCSSTDWKVNELIVEGSWKSASLLFGAEDSPIAGLVLDSVFSNLFDLIMLVDVL
ncbi:protein FAR1-RELATED SEQUENCE 4-like [Zingiber officinale]|uniref:protein FAR1-RELATED SEQUENCE 4-like n=1 Tax=Zingiber officinale TaxID=94328 RepID=UPI001C4BAA56|nr:protein FAR1-RELATED SEQUENCE 4-like [Zingiber officinale]